MNQIPRFRAFTPQALLAILRHLPPVQRYWLAYSGGLDSHVLLHAMSCLHAAGEVGAVRVVHVNHNLQASAAAWGRHCAQVCASLRIPYHEFSVDARSAPGVSPEAAARTARYEAIASVIETGDCLLTAHHQDDQAETLLLQLLRGAGPHGLASMPRWTAFSQGHHARPLLSFSRGQLHDYAQAQALVWVDDPTNFDTGYERNYLRHDIMPRLREHWPGVTQTLARAATHAAEAAQLLDMLAQQDRDMAQGLRADMLKISVLKDLPGARRRNVLRYWIKAQGLPLPEMIHVQHIESDVLAAAVDSEPCVRWDGAELRRYRDHLYLMPPLAAHDASVTLPWNLADPLPLAQGGRLLATRVKGQGLQAAMFEGRQVEVRYRRGGERCQPVGQAHHRELKTLFQERAVPPWQRDRIPLLFADGELVGAVGLFYCVPYAAGPEEMGIDVQWRLE